MGKFLTSFLKRWARAVAVCFEATASIVGIAMLLSFPASSAHFFGDHFRSNEVRRTIVRHAFVAGPEADSAQTIVRIDTEPTIPIPVPVIVAGAQEPVVSYELSSDSSHIRLLHRFKLGQSRSRGPDPLL